MREIICDWFMSLVYSVLLIGIVSGVFIFAIYKGAA